MDKPSSHQFIAKNEFFKAELDQTTRSSLLLCNRMSLKWMKQSEMNAVNFKYSCRLFYWSKEMIKNLLLIMIVCSIEFKEDCRS